jgi:PAS domain S-box-containing protein
MDPTGKVVGGVETFRDITATIQQDLILDSITDGVFAVDRDMRITAFNKAAEKITGWSSAEVIGVPCHEIFHSSICGDACILAKSVDSGKFLTHAHTVFVKGKDGRNVPISISAAPLMDPTGEVIGGVETFRDITATIQQDLILDSITDGVFTVDRDMRVTSFNKAAEQITGWTSGEVLGVPCRDIFHSSICGEACILAKSVGSGLPMAANRTVFVKDKNDQTIPININAAPLMDPDGNVIGGVETFRDVTNSIQKDLIFNSIADGVFTVDRNWKITSFNQAAEIITGWTKEKAIGKSCSEVFQSSICGDECAIAKSMYSGKPVANRSIFIKDIEGKQIPISISAAPLLDHEGNVIGGAETFRDLSVVTELRKQLHSRYTCGEIISKSASMQRIFSILPDIANSESNVLILGESGTGKEVMARALYSASGRHNKPFIAVNCGALPETLLESELFGYKAGAFTDAKRDKQGRFAAAENGTLFLDEIGDIPASLQVKLLRVLQERVYEPLGSNKPVKADVRIITATNKDLQALVKEGLYREDLFYRLNVVKIHLPPLRDRMEDIPMLIEHFIKKFGAQQGKDIVGISDTALNILMHHDYPGNIRELENIIEYSFILCQGGFIQPEHLPEPFSPTDKFEELNAIIPGKKQTLEEIEKAAIYQTLETNKWKKLATCRDLGISKDTLRRKILLYKLKSPLEMLTEE